MRSELDRIIYSLKFINLNILKIYFFTLNSITLTVGFLVTTENVYVWRMEYNYLSEQ